MREFPFDPSDQKTLKRLQQMPVFDAMESERLPRILEPAKLRRYEAGEVIITEGDTDQMVYFLIMGRCSVSVEGLEINTISQLGDIFGEMGIVDHGPRSATVTAKKSVLCLALDGTFIERLKGIDKLAAEALFYRIFSEILAARIREANAKIIKLEDDLTELSIQRPSV